jgi:hypothetical protein
MTIRSILDETVARIGRGMAFSRRPSQASDDGGNVSGVEGPVSKRVRALKETKTSRGWLVGLALVALALVVSLILA